MTDKEKDFEPSQFNIDLKGKDYLPVAARVKWFRHDHPQGVVRTREVLVDHELGYARFRAEVCDEDGNLLATGTKTEYEKNFPDYVEKAETGAVGRALAFSGYGTELDAELDEGRVVDTPRERPHRATPKKGDAPGATLRDWFKALEEAGLLEPDPERGEGKNKVRGSWYTLCELHGLPRAWSKYTPEEYARGIVIAHAYAAEKAHEAAAIADPYDEPAEATPDNPFEDQ